MAQVITISEPRAGAAPPVRGFALFRYGFRPFFLLGALFGMAALSYFMLWMSGMAAAWPSAWDALSWHRHEMIFGYAVAIIAGFLFTAVPNWTGQATPKGKALFLIVLLWFAGRMALFFSAYLPLVLVVAVDLSFLPVCALGIAPALIKSNNRRNYFFILLLLLLTVANSLTHWGNHTEDLDIESMGIRLGLSIVILMMVIVGGRVIPFFTEKPLGITIRRYPVLERFALIATLSALALDVAGQEGRMTGVVFLAAALANAGRFLQWRSLMTFGTPLLWVLHAGYAWLIIGFAIRALYDFGLPIPSGSAAHAFTAGGIGVLTLGMMARVSLGHSGRLLTVGKAMSFAFACVNLAAAFRVFGVWFFPNSMMLCLEVAGVFWFLAFATFIVIYAPILVRARPDGRDG